MPPILKSDMTAAEYSKALRALDWAVVDAAPHLGVSRRQAQRFASGESPIPGPVARLIRLLLERDKPQPKA